MKFISLVLLISLTGSGPSLPESVEKVTEIVEDAVEKPPVEDVVEQVEDATSNIPRDTVPSASELPAPAPAPSEDATTQDSGQPESEPDPATTQAPANNPDPEQSTTPQDTPEGSLETFREQEAEAFTPFEVADTTSERPTYITRIIETIPVALFWLIGTLLIVAVILLLYARIQREKFRQLSRGIQDLGRRIDSEVEAMAAERQSGQDQT